MDRNTSWVTSGGAGALIFSGGTQTVQMPQLINWGAPDAFHLSAWINPANLSGTKGFIGVDSNGLGPEFRLNGNNLNLLIQGALNIVTSGGAVLANAWSLVGVNYSNKNFAWETFVNGARTASGTGPNGFVAASVSRMQISAATVGDAWTGSIDDVSYFNTALTASEVRFIFEQGRGGGLLMQPPRRRSVAAIIAALVLACETANYSLTNQAAGLFASRLLAADQAQYILSGNAANTTASRLLSVDPASYTATGNDAATICARLLDGGAAAYALTGTDAGLIANRKLTADQAVCFLAGNNAELLRSLKLNAGSMALQLDNFAASLLADRKISADGAQYILVVSDANLTGSASGVAPYYYLFMMRGPQ
jgi:hypothetical protein